MCPTCTSWRLASPSSPRDTSRRNFPGDTTTSPWPTRVYFTEQTSTPAAAPSEETKESKEERAKKLVDEYIYQKLVVLLDP